jgi:hypothetical protein
MNADDSETLLPVPEQLDDEQARLYYPVVTSGEAAPGDSLLAIERFVRVHPALEAFHRTYTGGIGALISHAHSLRVLHLDERRFVYRPRIPFLRLD